MTHPSDAVDDLPTSGDGTEVVLHSFAVMARFRCAASSGQQAEALVREQLQVVRGLYDDAKVEPQEPDGRWAVDVRFVVASVDGETAVAGVHDTLRQNQVPPDEAWLAQALP